MSLELASRVTGKAALLQDRAKMFSKVRTFFAQRGVMEVDVPILSQFASVDTQIDLIAATACKKRAYLHSSPEYGMKRLLADGIGDIYQLSHVFRDGEVGEKHNPEFMMAEWYRLDFSLEEMIEECISFVRLFIEDLSETYEILSYKEALLRYAGTFPDAIEERDYLFGFEVEPQLGNGKITVIDDYPVAQAALAQTREKKGEMVAERFEIYFQGMELANGYHELSDPLEQSRRLQEANEIRGHLGKERYPIDHHFLEALQKGMPNCCGVAFGFDRLMMLRHHAVHLSEITPFIWEKA